MQIFSTGGTERVAILSTYPRVYKNVSFHLESNLLPLWIESATLPTGAIDKKTHVLPVIADALTGQLCEVTIIEGWIDKGAGWVQIAVATAQSFLDQISTGSLKAPKPGPDPDKVLVAIKYQRLFR